MRPEVSETTQTSKEVAIQSDFSDLDKTTEDTKQEEPERKSSHLLNPEFGIDESDFRVSKTMEKWEDEWNQKLFEHINEWFDQEEQREGKEDEAEGEDDEESSNQEQNEQNHDYNSDIQRNYEELEPQRDSESEQVQDSDVDTIASTVKSIAIGD